MSTDLEKPPVSTVGPPSDSKEAPIEGAIEEGNVVEAGDSQLLGVFLYVNALGLCKIANWPDSSPAGLQAGVEASVLDRPDLRYRL